MGSSCSPGFSGMGCPVCTCPKSTTVAVVVGLSSKGISGSLGSGVSSVPSSSSFSVSVVSPSVCVTSEVVSSSFLNVIQPRKVLIASSLT